MRTATDILHFTFIPYGVAVNHFWASNFYTTDQAKEVIENCLNNKTRHYAVLKNMYCGWNGFYGNEFNKIANFQAPWFRMIGGNGPIIGAFDQVIHIGHESMNCYGHIIIDYFNGLLAFPREILYSSYITMPFSSNFKGMVLEFLDALEIPRERLLQFPDLNKFFFAKKMYTLAYPFLGFTTVYKQYELGQILIKKWNLTKIKPDIYAYQNRDPNTKRHILNIQVLLDRIKSDFNIDLVKLQNVYPSLKITAINFRRCRFMLSTGGSNSNNQMFMAAQSTSAILFGLDAFDLSFFLPQSINGGDIYIFQEKYGHYFKPFNMSIKAIDWVADCLNKSFARFIEKSNLGFS